MYFLLATYHVKLKFLPLLLELSVRLCWVEFASSDIVLSFLDSRIGIEPALIGVEEWFQLIPKPLLVDLLRNSFKKIKFFSDLPLNWSPLHSYESRCNTQVSSRKNSPFGKNLVICGGKFSFVIVKLFKSKKPNKKFSGKFIIKPFSRNRCYTRG